MGNQVSIIQRREEADRQFTTQYLAVRYGDRVARRVSQELTQFDVVYSDAAKLTGISIEVVNGQIRYRKRVNSSTPGIWISRQSALEQQAAAEEVKR